MPLLVLKSAYSYVKLSKLKLFNQKTLKPHLVYIYPSFGHSLWTFDTSMIHCARRKQQQFFLYACNMGKNLQLPKLQPHFIISLYHWNSCNGRVYKCATHAPCVVFVQQGWNLWDLTFVRFVILDSCRNSILRKHVWKILC